jgi:pseudo-rSAM protein
MKNDNSKRWFSLFPSIFIWRKKNECLFYDSTTFRCKYFDINNAEIEDIIATLQFIDNLYCIEISDSLSSNQQAMSFLEELENLKMGVIVSENETQGKKPIQLPPLLNLQSAVEQLTNKELTDLTVGENILDYLCEIHIKLSANIELAVLKSIINLIDSLKFSNLYAIKISEYHPALNSLTEFWQMLNSISVIKTIILDFKKDIFDSLLSVEELNLLNINLFIRVNPNFDEELLKKVERFFQSKEIVHEYEFMVSQNEEFENIQIKIKDAFLNTISFKPFFNGQNYSFFEQYIYLDEKDIQHTVMTKKNIFAHQVLNTNDFGKITITSDGKVYGNTYFPPLGTIENDVRMLLYQEMSYGTSWRRIRDMKPCTDCIYQWLCPSPSDYELAIGRPNLCHVKP